MTVQIKIEKKAFRSRAGVHSATVKMTTRLPVVEGFEKYHENSLYRQGRLPVLLNRQETAIYAVEDFDKVSGQWVYRFSV